MIGKVESMAQLSGWEEIRKAQKKKEKQETETSQAPQRVLDEKLQEVSPASYDSSGKWNITPGRYVDKTA